MARMRQTGPARYVVVDSPVGFLLAGGGALAALLWLVATPTRHVALPGLWLLPALFAIYAFAQCMMRHRLELDTEARRYIWRFSHWPGSRPFVGDLDRDAKGLVVDHSPCGGRRACRAGWGIFLVFRTSLGEVQLDTWSLLDEAQAQARQLAEELRLPLLDHADR